MGPGIKTSRKWDFEFRPYTTRGTPKLPWSLSAILCTALQLASSAATWDFTLQKIQAKNLMLGNCQHHIGESSPIGRIGRDYSPRAACLSHSGPQVII